MKLSSCALHALLTLSPVIKCHAEVAEMATSRHKLSCPHTVPSQPSDLFARICCIAFVTVGSRGDVHSHRGARLIFRTWDAGLYT